MDTYSKDTLMAVLQLLGGKVSKMSAKAVLVEQIKAIVCNGVLPLKEPPARKVKAITLPALIRPPKAKAKATPPKATPPKATPRKATPPKATPRKAVAAWAPAFAELFDEGNAGCLRYSSIEIEIKGAVVDGVATTVAVAIDGEMETTEIKAGRTTLLSDTHFDQDSGEVQHNTVNVLMDTLRKVTAPAAATVAVTVTGMPSGSACHAGVPGNFGAKVLRDVFGAFIHSACGVPKANIAIVEETEDRDIAISW